MLRLSVKNFVVSAFEAAAVAEVAERLTCGIEDDLIHRLSPYLKRKQPVDILDLWPGAGLWSSKINDFLKPRRHVLVEPDLKAFGAFLNPLAESKDSYKLISSSNLYGLEDWHGLLANNFPEQGPSCADTSGALPKNDTLLVLANPPPNLSKRDHFTPARWWSIMLEMCMRQAGLHSYGSVRLLATLPSSEMPAVMPRTVIDRRRPGLLVESLALHAFEVAAPDDPGAWVISKSWDLYQASAARVAERMAENKIETPSGREPRGYSPAPPSPDPGQKPVPYIPRVKTDMHARLMEIIDDTARAEVDTTIRKKRMRALIQLNQENRRAFLRRGARENKIKLDELIKGLSRAAADPNATAESLKGYTEQAEAISQAISTDTAEIHFDILSQVASLMDDRRASLWGGSFDDAILLWDRRPFEPLRLDPEELFPRGFNRSMIYFEADPNSPVMQRLKNYEPAKRTEIIRLFEALSLVYSNRGTMLTSELLSLMFPNRPTNDLVRTIPSLATFATKRLKADFDNQPKTVHGAKGQDPVTCFQENIDYDFSDVRIRGLPIVTLWDILLEYIKTTADVSPVQLNRLLGGTMTSYRSGDYGGIPDKRLH